MQLSSRWWEHKMVQVLWREGSGFLKSLISTSHLILDIYGEHTVYPRRAMTMTLCTTFEAVPFAVAKNRGQLSHARQQIHDMNTA